MDQKKHGINNAFKDQVIQETERVLVTINTLKYDTKKLNLAQKLC